LDEGEYVRGAKTGEWVIYGPDGAESSTETWSAGVRTRVVPKEPSRWLPLQGDAAFSLLVGNTNVMAAALYLGYARGGAPFDSDAETEGPFYGLGAQVTLGAADDPDCLEPTRCASRWTAEPAARIGRAFGHYDDGLTVWPDTYLYAQLSP